MNKIALTIGAAAAAAMIAAPVAAADRFSAPAANESEMGGEGSTLLFAVVAGLALIGAIILITEDDDEAVSP